MRVGIVSAFVDYHRHGAHHRGPLQPQVGPLIAALLPDWVEVDVVNDTWEDPDWTRDYNLLFISALHSDFDRARQISHYWRRRGAKTVLGGTFASTFPHLAAKYFDAVVVGDADQTVPVAFSDFCRGSLRPLYTAPAYRASRVPTPRLELACEKQQLPFALEATRGCPFTCEFCILTGIGTRFETRPVAGVIRDVTAARAVLRGRVRWPRDRLLVLYDNNIGGNFAWLRELAGALGELAIPWGGAISFNAARNGPVIHALAAGGCCYLYVGLESFNERALAAMNKRHNLVRTTRSMIEQTHRHGIVLSAGLMISPEHDDEAYMRAIPGELTACGLHVPTYICFETPIPGTPLFHRLAREPGAFLPGALLRDFNTYTLVTRPRRQPADEFVAAYRALIDTVYAPHRRAAKVVRDSVRLARAGGWWAMTINAAEQWRLGRRSDPGRTYMAGTDRVPPEAAQVPFGDTDFASEEERRGILDPWRVTDEAGRVLPQWLGEPARVSRRLSASASAPSAALGATT